MVKDDGGLGRHNQADDGQMAYRRSKGVTGHVNDTIGHDIMVRGRTKVRGQRVHVPRSWVVVCR